MQTSTHKLMAWIRTALSLIGFGFGIGKLDAYLQGAGLHTRFDLPHSSLIFGASFIVVGILGLLAAIVQHARILKRLSRPDFAYNAMRPIAMTVAALLMLIGIFGLIAILW
jgi:putative membrane protein